MASAAFKDNQLSAGFRVPELRFRHVPPSRTDQVFAVRAEGQAVQPRPIIASALQGEKLAAGLCIEHLDLTFVRAGQSLAVRAVSDVVAFSLEVEKGTGHPVEIVPLEPTEIW